MEPKAALSAIKDFIAPVAPSNAPDVSEGAKDVSVKPTQAAQAEAAASARQAEPPPPVENGPQPGDLRLVIEHDAQSGEFVYKTVDRRTGETLQQFPREQILKLREESSYESGAVFDGQA